MLLRFLGTSNGSEEALSVSEGRRKNGADEAACVGGTTTERRCKEVTLEDTASGAGGDEIKLGDVVSVSDLRPDGLEGVGVGAGVGSSLLVADKSLSGLSDSGRRLRPLGR
jgi:hypothetical protein